MPVAGAWTMFFILARFVRSSGRPKGTISCCATENYQENVGNIVHSGFFVTGYVQGGLSIITHLPPQWRYRDT